MPDTVTGDALVFLMSKCRTSRPDGIDHPCAGHLQRRFAHRRREIGSGEYTRALRTAIAGKRRHRLSRVTGGEIDRRAVTPAPCCRCAGEYRRDG